MAARPLAGLAILACASLPAAAQGACRIDEAQRFFAETPRPIERIDALLADCRDEAATDYRVDLLRGVAARDTGHLDEAIAVLQHAHRVAPREPAPTLELAVTYEWRGEPKKARALYEAVLADTPDSRPALLGMARVARQQSRIADARAIYMQLLAGNPDDVEARTGMAWLELDDKHFHNARDQFEAVLKTHPDNTEAKTGLDQVAAGWRYQFDAGATLFSLSTGTAYGGGARLQIDLNSTDSLIFGLAHNTRELPTENPTDPTPLPSNSGSIGFQRLLPGSYHWGVVYEYRERSDFAGENRVLVDFGSYLTRTVQWFGGVRQGFPSPWKNRLIYLGLTASVVERWNATLTGYLGHNQSARDSQSVVLDMTREGPGQLLYSAGAGYGFNPDNFIIHGRVVWPVTVKQAVNFGMEYRTFGHELVAVLGWRFNWQ
jgi:tetratricopeptide (TPR) repeat protein